MYCICTYMYKCTGIYRIDVCCNDCFYTSSTSRDCEAQIFWLLIIFLGRSFALHPHSLSGGCVFRQVGDWCRGWASTRDLHAGWEGNWGKIAEWSAWRAPRPFRICASFWWFWWLWRRVGCVLYGWNARICCRDGPAIRMIPKAKSRQQSWKWGKWCRKQCRIQKETTCLGNSKCDWYLEAFQKAILSCSESTGTNQSKLRRFVDLPLLVNRLEIIRPHLSFGLEIHHPFSVFHIIPPFLTRFQFDKLEFNVQLPGHNNSMNLNPGLPSWWVA